MTMFTTGTMANYSRDYSVLSSEVEEGAQTLETNYLAPDPQL